MSGVPYVIPLVRSKTRSGTNFSSLSLSCTDDSEVFSQHPLSLHLFFLSLNTSRFFRIYTAVWSCLRASWLNSWSPELQHVPSEILCAQQQSLPPRHSPEPCGDERTFSSFSSASTSPCPPAIYIPMRIFKAPRSSQVRTHFLGAQSGHSAARSQLFRLYLCPN